MKTVYLTGAPSAGKSTTARALRERIPGLMLWEYGAELTRYVSDRSPETTQEDLRRLSANFISPEDISAVDEKLLEFVKTNRAAHPIIIDSHPVTKEDYGYRVTAFSADQIRVLSPDEIWVLFTPPEVAVDRINLAAEGRAKVNTEQARLHTSLQVSVAASYGIAAGRPVYLFDSSVDQQALVERLVVRLKK